LVLELAAADVRAILERAARGGSPPEWAEITERLDRIERALSAGLPCDDQKTALNPGSGHGASSPRRSEIQERAQDAPHGGQLIGCDGAKAVVEALICHRPHVFGPGEGGKLAQARR
jgi:hypothetical protein